MSNIEGTIINNVMIALGMDNNEYQKERITIFIDMVRTDLVLSGVSPEVAKSKMAIGAITRGVIDSWDYNSGVKKSPSYIEDVIKLRSVEIANEEGVDNGTIS